MRILGQFIDRLFLFRHDSLQAGGVALSLLLLSITALYLLTQYGHLPQKVLFWSSLPWGEEQLAPKRFLWFLLGITMGVGTLNLVLARLIHRFLPIAGRLAVMVTATIAVFTSMIIIRIIRLLVP